MNRFSTLLLLLAALIYVVAMFILGHWVQQDDSTNIIIHYLIAFATFIYLIYSASKGRLSISAAVGIGIFLRLILLYAFPNLSNDIYRFLWDGRLIHDGIHPLSYLPSELMSSGRVGEWASELYSSMNSQEYFTIYPPISQLVFYLSTLGDSWSLATSAMVMKAILFIADIGLLAALMQLLRKMQQPAYLALLYFLNPLVIMEVGGQVHYEGLMVCFLAFSLLLLSEKKYLFSGGALALSVGVKLLPLMFVPLFLCYLDNNSQRIKFFGGLTSILLVSFFPFLIGLDIGHFFSSLNLYFQKFEFNASVYYLLRYIGKLLTGYNQIAIIGPLLSLISLGLILKISFSKELTSMKVLLSRMFYCFAIYLFLATTVHPWYLIMLIFCGLFTSYRWFVAWSALIVLSYSTYATPDFTQNMYLIALEYSTMIAVLIWEYRKQLRSI